MLIGKVELEQLNLYVQNAYLALTFRAKTMESFWFKDFVDYGKIKW